MYEPQLIEYSKTFNVKLIQVVYGKKYHFVALIDIPKDTPYGTKVLNVTISPLGINKIYLWDEIFNNNAYEEYIRCICVEYFSKGYNETLNKGITYGVLIINNGSIWINNNYKGNRNWEEEFNGIEKDIKNFNGFGKANLLSKIREIKTLTIGLHYSNENSYQRQLIDQSHYIDISKLPIMTITEEKIICISININ